AVGERELDALFVGYDARHAVAEFLFQPLSQKTPRLVGVTVHRYHQVLVGVAGTRGVFPSGRAGGFKPPPIGLINGLLVWFQGLSPQPSIVGLRGISSIQIVWRSIAPAATVPGYNLRRDPRRPLRPSRQWVGRASDRRAGCRASGRCRPAAARPGRRHRALLP